MNDGILTGKQAWQGIKKLESVYQYLRLTPAWRENYRDLLDIILECERLISVERFTRKKAGFRRSNIVGRVAEDACCQTKYGRFCGGECTCRVCAPDLHKRDAMNMD